MNLIKLYNEGFGTSHEAGLQCVHDAVVADVTKQFTEAAEGTDVRSLIETNQTLLADNTMLTESHAAKMQQIKDLMINQEQLRGQLGYLQEQLTSAHEQLAAAGIAIDKVPHGPSQVTGSDSPE